MMTTSTVSVSGTGKPFLQSLPSFASSTVPVSGVTKRILAYGGIDTGENKLVFLNPIIKIGVDSVGFVSSIVGEKLRRTGRRTIHKTHEVVTLKKRNNLGQPNRVICWNRA